MVSALAFVVTCAIVFSAVESTHFLGTTINWHAVGDQLNGGAGKLRFNFRIAWRSDTSEGRCTALSIADQTPLGSNVKWRCLSNNCGTLRLGSFLYICTSFSTAGAWSSGGNTFDFTFPVSDSVTEFIIGNDYTKTYRCCWKETQNAAGDIIRFRTRISFIPRTDISGVVNRGEINQSPVTDMVPLIPARVGCEFRMIIPNADPDFDDVKCRWAVTNGDDDLNECGSACITENLPRGKFNATLIEEDCEIRWIPQEAGQYAAAVQLEDFYPTDVGRTNPLSSIPLQWLINVEPRTTSCDSRPVFPPQENIPREQPRCFAVADGGNLTLEILVGHSNFPAQNVNDSLYILPRGMSVTGFVDQGNGVKSVTFSWKPDAEQANRPHFMCFLFLDDALAPSNLQCFTIVTTVPQPKPILNTQSEAPLVGGQTAFDAIASISFDEEVKNPTVGPRFISVYHVASGQLIQRIDSSDAALVTVSADFKTVSFQLESVQPNLFVKGEEYEIVIEDGALVGRAASCPGGGPVAKGVKAGEWTFISAGPPNECIAGTDNCHARANCIDLPDGFRCECMIGYTGDGVNNCDDINECAAVTHDCHARAICTNTQGSFTCECMPGYTGDGKNCDDINECTVPSHNCHPNADCTNQPGTFSCACRFGYTGDGVDCVDVNECVEGTDFDCDLALTKCVNTDGDYSCMCKTGYKVDAGTTTDPTRPVCVDCNECLPECQEAIDEACHAKATCSNTVGSYDCTCDAGYEPDPGAGKPANRPVCIDINECTRGRDNCNANADCSNTDGSFTCACRPGYSGDGVDCVDINECAEGTDNCHDMADCTNTDGSFDCSCKIGYKPDASGAPANRPVCIDCNECIGECQPSIDVKGACHVNADCSNTAGSFDCACKDGYQRQAGSPVDRPVCVNINECTAGTHTCHEKAVCIDEQPPLKFDCQCMPGYEPGAGSTPNRPVCVNIDECAADTDTCHEKAVCIDAQPPLEFDCQCMPGYEPGPGSTPNRPVCINIDECAADTDTCHEKAVCIDEQPPLKFDCQCMPGYKPGPGSAPNRPVCVNCNECMMGDCPMEPNPFCHEKAICTDMPGTFGCECMVGYAGDGFNCIDVSNCTGNWPINRDRWMNEEEGWLNSTEECPALGDRLPDPAVDLNDPPINQWDDLRDNFIASLAAWLATASRIPGMPDAVPDVSMLDPDDQWEALKAFENQLYNVWYTQVGQPNGFSRPIPIGECDDKRLEQWNHFIQTSQDAQEKYYQIFGSRCDAV